MRHFTFKITTLGCKVNQYESQRLRETLESLGLRSAGRKEPPDVWLVNTCSVTHVADRKARRLIRQKKKEAPRSRVFVTGCYAAVRKEALQGLDEVDGVYGTGEWDELVSDVAALAGAGADGTGKLSAGLTRFRGRARAFVKIQDGCDSFCSYCIVPYARGAPRSRDLEDALEEGRRMIDSGAGELVLSGIHLGLYGRDLEQSSGLHRAVEAFADLDENVRIRLSSLEGPEVDERLLEAMARPNVCAHLHLPLQSGDPDVLKAMKRGYSPRDFSCVIEKARERLDQPAISTDVMVGFPGETDSAFANTLNVCKEAKFSRMHVFCFSPRPGTAACGMGPAVGSKTAKARSESLRALDRRLQNEWAGQFVGRRVRVLYEEIKPGGWMHGYSDRYVPVRAPADRRRLGTPCRTRISGCRDGELEGDVRL